MNRNAADKTDVAAFPLDSRVAPAGELFVDAGRRTDEISKDSIKRFCINPKLSEKISDRALEMHLNSKEKETETKTLIKKEGEEKDKEKETEIQGPDMKV